MPIVFVVCGSGVLIWRTTSHHANPTGLPEQPSSPGQGAPKERIGLRLSSMQEGVLTSSIRIPFEPKVPRVDSKGSLFGDARAAPKLFSEIEIKRGDTLAEIFARLKIPPGHLAEILALPEVAENLKTLRVGTKLRYAFVDSVFSRFEYQIDDFRTLSVERRNGVLQASVAAQTPEIRNAASSGVITRSLFVDLQRAGVPDAMILAFADLFGWDVDFVRDIRKGDRFKIIFEEIFREGHKVGNGRILAAEFSNGEKNLRAFYFKAKDGTEGYFSQAGEAMKKAFLIAPLNFTKVSSRFNLARMHPVLNRIRAHKGVDYAAPMGTAVRAVANGRIDFAGQQSGYGNVLVLKHGERYTTLYGHLMKFASGVSRGDTVKQGQLIGYVGMSGLATGPHLHYEFRINGAHVDPLTVKLPRAIPLDKKYLASFRQTVDPLFERLAALDSKDANNAASVVSRDPRREASSSN